MQRSIRVSALCAFTLITFLVAHRPAAGYPIKFNVIIVGPPGSVNSNATAVSNNGYVVGYTDTAQAASRAFVWHDGKIQVLGTLWKDPTTGQFVGNSAAYGVNDSGQVVGRADKGNGVIHAFLWPDPNKPGQMKDLGTLSGANSTANAINDSGQIVGAAQLNNGNYHAFLYSGGVMADLGVPDSSANSEAISINTKGVIVGNTGFIPFGVASYIYDNTGWHRFGANTTAKAIGAYGDVVGNSISRTGLTYEAFRYDPDFGTLTNLPPLPGDIDSAALGVNRYGETVGESVGTSARAVLLFDGTTTIDLNTVAVNSPFSSLLAANAINDSDWIVGAGSVGNTSVAYLLQPQPRAFTYEVAYPTSIYTAINSSGQGAGFGTNSTGNSLGLFFNNGTTTTIGPLPGDTDSALYALNDFGQAVGESWYLDSSGNRISQTLLYANGVASSLGLPVYVTNYGESFNDLGGAAGGFIQDDANGIRFKHGYLYSASTGTVQDLGTLGGANSEARSLNNSSQVTGWAQTGTFDIWGNPIQNAFLYTSGGMSSIGTLGGDNSQGNAISPDGQVAGWSQLPADAAGNSATHAFFYLGASKISSMVDLGTLRPDSTGNSVAYGMNSFDGVVGASDTDHEGTHAFVYGFPGGNGLMLDLNSLLPPGSGVTLTSANAINDAGQIAGAAVIAGSGGMPQGFVMSPIKLLRLSVSPTIVPGSKNAAGKVLLSAPAPALGVLVPLSSSNTVTTVPYSVWVAPGATSASFPIKTAPVTSAVAVTIGATLGDDTLSANLTVRPIGVKSLSLSPDPVTGGVSVAGKVTLEAPAAQGDITVTLSSSNVHIAYPTTTSITIPAGQTSGSFAVQTLPVPAATAVKITATANGIARRQILTVDP